MFSQIHFQSIDVSDTSRALQFYTQVMGFGIHTDAPYGEDRWIFLDLSGAQTLLHFNKVVAVSKTETPVLVLNTEDVDGTCETLVSRGVTIDKGPDEAPWAPGTRWAIFQDSEGNMILIQNVKG